MPMNRRASSGWCEFLTAIVVELLAAVIVVSVYAVLLGIACFVLSWVSWAICNLLP